MSLPINNNTSKDNKPFDYCNEKLLDSIELFRDFFAVELYEYSSRKGITNIIHEQIQNKYQIIVIKCSYFQKDKAILLLIHTLLEREIEKALKYALEITFACNLTRKKIIIEHDFCNSTFW